jgi:hypothetical protein
MSMGLFLALRQISAEARIEGLGGRFRGSVRVTCQPSVVHYPLKRGRLRREPRQSRQQHLLGWAVGLIPARIVQPMLAGKQKLK